MDIIDKIVLAGLIIVLIAMNVIFFNEIEAMEERINKIEYQSKECASGEARE